jgi:hypothetical protein
MRGLRALHTLLAGILLFAFPEAIAGDMAVPDHALPETRKEAARFLASSLSRFIPSIAVEDIVVEQEQSPPEDSSTPSNVATEAGDDQSYLIETAYIGGTMTRQGPELAIGRLHPEFAKRLARAIHEARESGLSLAGIFSAYRPPAFGVGGFADKFNSLHTYGLAVDMRGIGGPGTPETRLWREIGAKHGIICPYGINNRAEWNHCQPTRAKIILPENPLRQTVTADGPFSLEEMFEVGGALIEDESAAALINADLSPKAAVQENAGVKHVRQRLAISAVGTLPAVQMTKLREGSSHLSQAREKHRSGRVADLQVKKVPSIMTEEGARRQQHWRSGRVMASRPARRSRSATHLGTAREKTAWRSDERLMRYQDGLQVASDWRYQL